MRRTILALAALAAAAPPAASPLAAAELLMFEEPGCVWCARWNEEVGDAYALTEEGRRAPLRRRELRAGPPAGVTLSIPAGLTPTFVLVEDGREIGRIEGYPGEDFFWPMLNALLRRLPDGPAPVPAGG